MDKQDELAREFGAEHDLDTFTIRFPDGHAITAWANGRLVVTKDEAGFQPFATDVAALSAALDIGGGRGST